MISKPKKKKTILTVKTLHVTLCGSPYNTSASFLALLAIRPNREITTEINSFFLSRYFCSTYKMSNITLWTILFIFFSFSESAYGHKRFSFSWSNTTKNKKQNFRNETKRSERQNKIKK